MDLNISKTIKSSQKQVYTAWLDANSIKQWHCGPPSKVISEPKVGGRLEIIFSPESCIIGEYKKLTPFSHISYSFKWGDEGDETLVKIDFIELEKSLTEVRIHHTGFPTQSQIDGHTVGWNLCFEGLEEMFPNS